MSKPDKKTLGLIPDKFHVMRSDGESVGGGKHDKCEYFVLDLSHDPFAGAAIEAYARACVGLYPKLSADLLAIANEAGRPWQMTPIDGEPETRPNRVTGRESDFDAAQWPEKDER